MGEYTVGDALRDIRSKSFTERAKGTTFEILMKRWFMTDPRYANLEKVWLWDEFPYRKDLGGGDLGIDLVARTDMGEYWAIQCKCYAEDATIGKAAVDSFLATSGRTFRDGGLVTRRFSQRVWVSTTNHWGANAEETIRNQDPPVSRVSLADLRDSPVDWQRLMDGGQGKDARAKGKQLREHQSNAISAAVEHYRDNDRGKLVMACGTGKTFTSLRLVERLTGGKGLVLFTVPSIGLLGQSLNDWAADAAGPMKAVCVCSDSRAARKMARGEWDVTEESVVDLAMPATTDFRQVARQLKAYRDHDGLVVVFSTYQSIDVVGAAQGELLRETHGEYGVFDFIVCDEAHRTTGVKLSDADESNFTKVHGDGNVRGRKRLYMTATPRLYGESAKIRASKADCVLCSMDDESIYGREFFRVNFSYAVSQGILTDYKVLVLTVTEGMIPPELMERVRNSEVKELAYDDTCRLVGVINGLSKKVIGDGGQTRDADPGVMRRALAFTHKIGSAGDPGTSRNIERIMPEVSERYNGTLGEEERREVVRIKARHVDGSMGALRRNEALDWLAGDAEDPQECRVVTNVRCLSEGIDVPALDAVIFMSARNSQVDIVQSVGRVMRSFHKGQPDEKKYGYIIIPIVIPENVAPEDALENSQAYSAVWSILNALRSHDDQFNALVNTMSLNTKKGGKLVPVTPGFRRDGIGKGDGGSGGALSGERLLREGTLHFDSFNGKFFARFVEKCGDRMYWENWAASVGEIAKKYISRITGLVAQPGSKYAGEFDEFVATLRRNLNPGVTPGQCIEMLAQHMVTRPVFEALFSDYEFIGHNDTSRSMQFMLEYFESEAVDQEKDTLKKFYDSVRVNVGKIDNLEGKQTVIKNLYEKFFKRAFPLTVETMGTVYTPVECVDFIIRSVDSVLRREFGTAITNDDVHILDPFVGTGTFITRLLQLGVIRPGDLKRKYMHEIHCNEIVLLAYYVADVNIEAVFHEQYKDEGYIPFGGICLTDTFQLGETEVNSMYNQFFRENSDAVERQRKARVRVIMGNPPYSIGQKSANDNAQNQHYPKLEQRIADTYVAASSANLSKGLYDSYIKAFRWSSDRLDGQDGGIVAFISNGAWIDGNTQDGFRACLAKEFDKIYVFNLRGNQRTSGELSRREGGKIFGSGSRTPIAITILVKYPKDRRNAQPCEILYHDIGDYLTREQKLDIIRKFGSVDGIKWAAVTPNEKHDWVNQRGGLFDTLLPLAPEKKFTATSQSVFSINAVGVAGGRDVWVSGFSRSSVENNMRSMIGFYNEQIGKEPSSDEKRISWTRALKKNLAKGIKHNYDGLTFVVESYRPFCKTNLYYHRPFIESPGIWNKVFPTKQTGNVVICLSCAGASNGLSCLVASIIPDYHFVGDTQGFPLYWYEENKHQQLDLFSSGDDKYIRHDGITDWFLEEVRGRFHGANSLTKEDIFYYVYGLLHSLDYRERFANDLRKALPRIPIVEDVAAFMAFSKAGRNLAALHLDYENVSAYPGVTVDGLEDAPTDDRAYDWFAVADKMEINDDKSAITLNSRVTVRDIPEKAYEYVVNGKSAIEWIVERYCVSVDKKSGIMNDCNAWAREHGKPHYILDLLLSVINVSIQTMDIVQGLPRLNL